jgi:hypothetical protein
MLREPRSGLLAAWGNALLAGLVSPDEAATHITCEDAVHRVEDLPGETRPVGLTLALGRLRALGATGLRVALPVAGHPLGLSGPPEFNARALEAEEAVICRGVALGLVPEVTGRAEGRASAERNEEGGARYERPRDEARRQGVRAPGSARGGSAVGPEGDVHVEVAWRVLPVREGSPADVPSLGEAERELAEALREATEVLSRMDVAGSGPVAEAAIDAYRARTERGRGQVLAPGYPPRAVRVLALAQRVGVLVSVAYESGRGGAVSAAEMGAQAEALRLVERVARRAQVAAYNAYVEERERR